MTRHAARSCCARAGRHFCAGANFAGAGDAGGDALYAQAVRLFAAATPVVAAVQGAAIGGGPRARAVGGLPRREPLFALRRELRAPGHPPRLRADASRCPPRSATQAALELLYTGRRVKGEEAHALGLCDRLAADGELRAQRARARVARSPPPPRWPCARSARRCAAISPIACAPRPSASTPSRRRCSRPKTSPRVCARAPSAARRASPAAERRPPAALRRATRARATCEPRLGLQAVAARRAVARRELASGRDPRRARAARRAGRRRAGRGRIPRPTARRPTRPGHAPAAIAPVAVVAVEQTLIEVAEDELAAAAGRTPRPRRASRGWRRA